MREEQKRDELPPENALVIIPIVTIEGNAAEHEMRHDLCVKF